MQNRASQPAEPMSLHSRHRPSAQRPSPASYRLSLSQARNAQQAQPAAAGHSRSRTAHTATPLSTASPAPGAAQAAASQPAAQPHSPAQQPRKQPRAQASSRMAAGVPRMTASNTSGPDPVSAHPAAAAAREQPARPGSAARPRQQHSHTVRALTTQPAATEDFKASSAAALHPSASSTAVPPSKQQQGVQRDEQQQENQHAKQDAPAAAPTYVEAGTQRSWTSVSSSAPQHRQPALQVSQRPASQPQQPSTALQPRQHPLQAPLRPAAQPEQPGTAPANQAAHLRPASTAESAVPVAGPSSRGAQVASPVLAVKPEAAQHHGPGDSSSSSMRQVWELLQASEDQVLPCSLSALGVHTWLWTLCCTFCLSACLTRSCRIVALLLPLLPLTDKVSLMQVPEPPMPQANVQALPSLPPLPATASVLSLPSSAPTPRSVHSGSSTIEGVRTKIAQLEDRVASSSSQVGLSVRYDSAPRH